MFYTTRRIILWIGVGILLTDCGNGITPTAAPALAPVLTSTSTPIPASASVDRLAVSLLYPNADTEVEMGQAVKIIIQVTDAQGDAVGDAQVTIEMQDPNGKTIATAPVAASHDKVYRSDALTIPHRVPEGMWKISIEAKTSHAQGHGSGSFKVKNSTSETLLSKYGFWLDAPTLKGIVPRIAAEKGDANNGLIIWGGVLPAQHVLPESWVEVHWLTGDYKLDSPQSIRRFMLAEVGNLGFTPVRDIGPFRPIRFKRWDAWQAEARGQLSNIGMEWVVFYAPEVDKTFAIATTVVLPPSGIDPHAVLRSSFDTDPKIHAAGVAPEPLPKLLPGPELVSPPLAARFLGTGQPIVLQWKSVKELAKDEYYEVSVDYNYDEANALVTFTTRDNLLTLPETLYQAPNCGVFNWQVTLKRQTGVDDAGHPIGESISYDSLYWYVQWRYPGDQPAPFPLRCPNPQF